MPTFRPFTKDKKNLYHDSIVNTGVGLDLIGGYYDEGNNIKFNFPQEATVAFLTWSGMDFAKRYKKENKYKILLDLVKWATNYFTRGHPEKDVLFVQVGDGILDHGHWFPPEYIDYKFPSLKIDEENHDSKVAGKTAAS